MMRYLKLLTLGCIFLLSCSLYAQQKFYVTLSTLPAVMQDIKAHLNLQGIDYNEAEIRHHLSTQLAVSDLNTGLPLPDITYLGLSFGSCFFQRGVSLSDIPIRSSLYDFVAGGTLEKEWTTQATSILYGRNQFSLYTFVTLGNGNTQSEMEIIIIDKDAFLTGNNGPWDITLFSRAGVHPNPASQNTQLTFDQPLDGPASIVVVEGATGKIMSQIMDQKDLPAGPYQQDIDLSNWSAGIYFCIVQTAGQTLRFPFVKTK